MIKLTFTKAKAQYVHRFTMEHKPRWANKPLANGVFYAPQYRSDREWYEKATFPPSPRCFGTDCHSGNPTWPLGMFLNYSFVPRLAEQISMILRRVHQRMEPL